MTTISISFELNLPLFGALLMILGLLGIIYNMVVDRLGTLHYGYTSLLVVGGVGMTLGGLAVICWQAAVMGAVCFVASGAPMIVGEAIRTKRQEMESLARMRSEALRQGKMGGEMNYGEGSD